MSTSNKPILCVVLVMVSALALACSSGGGDQPAGQATQDPVASAQAAATSSLLTLADFPADWHSQPHDNTKLGLTGECALLDADDLPGQVAGADSDRFIAPDDRESGSQTAVFPNEDAATKMLDDYFKAVADCSGELTAAYEKLFRDSAQQDGVDPSLVEVQFSLKDISLPDWGDASKGYRLAGTFSVKGVSKQMNVDIAVIRQGQTLGSYYYANTAELDLAEETHIGEIVASRLRALR